MILETKVGGLFRITATKPDGTERVLADWFPNLIVNSGLDRSANAGAFSDARIAVGSGTTPPTAGDTTMQTLVATTNTEVAGEAFVQPTLLQPYGFHRRVYRFAPGTATGNLSEIGLVFNYVSPSSYGLFARSLIKDGGGSPTTITVLPEETLNVTYEIRCYQPLTDGTGSVTIAGVTYNYTVRAGGGGWANFSTQGAENGVINFDSFCRTTGAALGDLVSNGSGPGAINSNPSGGSVAAYTPGTYYRDTTVSWNTTKGDASTPIWFFYLNTYRGGWQILLDAGIPKTNLNELSLTFRQTWSAV
jgi:hypothetical protein